MAEHVPHYPATPAITFAAGGTITGGRLVESSAGMTVITAPAASTKVAGVAANDAVSGQNLPVYGDGVHRLVATGAIAAGDVLAAAANGTVAPIGANAFATKVGRALEAIADGASGRVRLTL